MNPIKTIKWVLWLALFTVFVFFQLSFIKNLPTPWSNLNLVLAILFLVTLLVNFHSGLWLAAFAGLLLEIYSPAPFGGIFFPLLLVLLLADFLFRLFFTNRSLYSLLILSTAGTILFHFFNSSYLWVLYRFDWSPYTLIIDNYYFIDVAWQLLLNAIFLSLLFLGLYFFSQRFKSVFLVGGRR
jgi:cell shape-determining protein MreD